MFKIRPVFKIALIVAFAVPLSIILCLSSYEYVKDCRRVRDVLYLVEKFDGDFQVKPVKGKFDGVRVTGAIQSGAKFEELCSAIKETRLRYNVSIHLSSGETELNKTIFEQE